MWPAGASPTCHVKKGCDATSRGLPPLAMSMKIMMQQAGGDPYLLYQRELWHDKQGPSPLASAMLKRVATRQAGVFPHLPPQWELQHNEQRSPPTCCVDENYDATSRGRPYTCRIEENCDVMSRGLPLLVVLKRAVIWQERVVPSLLHLRAWCSIVEKHISILYYNKIQLQTNFRGWARWPTPYPHHFPSWYPPSSVVVSLLSCGGSTEWWWWYGW